MNKYIETFKDWLELRPQREQGLLIIAILALIYAIFNLVLFRPLDNDKLAKLNDIQAINDKIKSWNIQIEALSKIPTTPLYKAWIQQHKTLKNMQTEYKYLLQTTANKQWQDIIKTMLLSEKNITLIQIKNSPETVYAPIDTAGSSQKIYQQQLQLTITTDFFGLVNYLERLESSLPYIHWDSMSYDVMTYPLAKVNLEFSIIYEKNT